MGLATRLGRWFVLCGLTAVLPFLSDASLLPLAAAAEPEAATGGTRVPGEQKTLSEHPQVTPGVTRVSLNGQAAGWELDESSGRLLAADIESKSVVPFDMSTGKQLKPIELGHHPGAMVIKGRRLVVASGDEPKLSFVNLDTDKVEGTLELPGVQAKSLLASRADNPFVYVFAAEEDNFAFLLQVDVTQRKARNAINAQDGLLRPAYQIAISADGQMCLALLGQRGSPSGVQFFMLDEQQGTMAPAEPFVRPTNSHTIMAGPIARLWTVGNQLVGCRPRTADGADGDLQEARGILEDGEPAPIRRFAGAPVAIHPQQDLVAAVGSGAAGTDLALQKLSSAEMLATVKLPDVDARARQEATEEEEEAPARSRRRNRPEQPAVQPSPPLLRFDAAHNRVAYAWGRVAHIVDLKPLKLPAQSAFFLSVPSQLRAQTGTPLELRVEMTNPEARKSATFKLVDAPKGASLDKEGVLRWTPSNRDVGTHVIQLAADNEGRSDQQEIGVIVTHPALQLDMIAQKMAVDYEGRRLVVAGYKLTRAREDNENNFRNGEQAPTELALIDLATKKIVVRRSIEQGVRRLHIDDRAVYIAPREGPVFHSLKFADLSNDKRVFVTDPVADFQWLPGGRLVVSTEQTTLCYKTDTLERAALPGMFAPSEDRRDLGFDPRMFRQFGRNRLPEGELTTDSWVGGGEGGVGVLFQGVVLNDKSGQIQMASGAFPVQRMSLDMFMEPERQRGDWAETALPALWGRIAGSRVLATAEGRQIVTWQPASALLLRKFPALASASANMNEQQRGDRASLTVSLLFRELVEGIASEPLTLVQQIMSQRRLEIQWRGELRPLLADAVDHVAVAFGQQLFLVPLTKEQFAKYVEPVHFVCSQDPLRAEVGGIAEVKFAATGGQGERRFSLPAPMAGLSIDEKSGTVRVDTNVVWQGMIGRMSELGIHEAVDLVTLGTAARADYQQLFGETTEKLPVRLRLQVAVQDAQGQSATQTSSLTLLGAAGEVSQAVADAKLKKQKEFERQRAEAAKRDIMSKAAGNEALVRQVTQLIDTQQQAATKAAETEHSLAKLDKQFQGITQQLASKPEPAKDEERDKQLLARVDNKFDAVSRRLDEAAAQQRQSTLTTLVITLSVALVTVLLVLGVMMVVLRRSAAPK